MNMKLLLKAIYRVVECIAFIIVCLLIVLEAIIVPAIGIALVVLIAIILFVMAVMKEYQKLKNPRYSERRGPRV